MKLNTIPFFLVVTLISLSHFLNAEQSNNSKATSDTPQTALHLSSIESKPQKSRMRKTSGKKKNQKKTLSVMNYEELETKKDQHKQNGNYDIAIKYLHQMMKLCDDINKQADNTLEMGDLLFSDGNFVQAGRVYDEFTAFYPGDTHIEYASYRSILCSYYCTFDAERDQTKTEETVNLCGTFLNRSDIFTEYADEVKKIQNQCYQKLAESELNVCDFYLKRNSLKAAELRLDELRTTWVERLPEIESQVLALEIRLAEKQNKTEIATEKKAALANKKSSPVKTAQNTSNMATRF